MSIYQLPHLPSKMMPLLAILGLISLALVSLLPTQHTTAHGYIERTDPSDGAELEASPETINVWFNEALVPNSANVSVVSGDGVTVGPLSIQHNPDDDTHLIIDLPTALPNSAYIMTISAVVVSDGHEPSGSIVFWVGPRAEAASATPAANDDSPQYALVGMFLGVLIACGGFGWLVSRADDRALPLATPKLPASESPPEHFKLD